MHENNMDSILAYMYYMVKMAKEKGITVIMSLHEIDLAQKVSDKVMCVHGDVISSFGTPDEIAAAALYLASKEAGYTTGAVLEVSGGL